MRTRVVIVGGPLTGKTTLAKRLGLPGVRHVDGLSDIADAFDAAGPWCIEGGSTVRSLRKWLDRNPKGKPADVVIGLWDPKAERTEDHESMAAHVRDAWVGIAPALAARGVEVISW